MLQVFSLTALRSAKQAVRNTTQPKKARHHQLINNNQCRHRTFFASSTDHSSLLQNAEIHKLKGSDTTTTTYVLAAEGMESDIVQKVPQLHLARLCLLQADDTATITQTIFGAKVVNSTLGAPKDVCGRLVDAALEDARLSSSSSSSSSTVVLAKSSLRGLSEWVEAGLDQQNFEPLASLDDATVQVLRDRTEAKDALVFERAWEQLAREFLQQERGDEAALYQSKGGVLSEIIHHADDSDYARSSGGSMAIFTMSL